MMQLSASQRSLQQRRSPGIDPGPVPNMPARAISPAVRGPGGGPAGVGVPRAATSSSTRSAQGGSTRRSNSNNQVPLSQIEKSVTHLLVATKQLLETLTQWSKNKASDSQVSDVYVRLGYEFNMACRAFTAINVDTSDLGNVPESLRHILEATLSQEASVESLEKYLPRIRDIIINLLQGLKRKQQKLRQKQPKGDRDGAAGVDRVSSTGTNASTSSSLTNMLEEGIENGGYSSAPRRGASVQGTMSNVHNASPHRRVPRDPSLRSLASGSDSSSLSGSTLQHLPVQPPYPGGDEISIPTANSEFSIDSFPPPPPPPKETSALAALQRGGDLERRASRRYSQYQVSKLLGGANGVPMLPTQTGPTPNRGRREMRESIQAVQSREGRRLQRSISKTALEPSPARLAPNKLEETPRPPPVVGPSTNTDLSEAAVVADKPAEENKYRMSANLSGPLDGLPVFPVDPEAPPKRPPTPETPKDSHVATKTQATPPPADKRGTSFSTPASSPPLTKDLTLFLQYKSKVKKFVLPEGFDELSIGRLQLAFIEKFSWNTQHNGADLPEIYIQDPVSGVRHELEDLSDIKDRTVLVLNIEALDEVKRHIDDGLGSIKQIVEEVKQNMTDQGLAIQRVSERQQETAMDMAKMAAARPSVMAETQLAGKASPGGTPHPIRKMSVGKLNEISTLRRDLAVLRQTYSSFQTDLDGSMSALRNKASNIKIAAAKVTTPDIDGTVGSSYVANGRKQMNSDSDTLVGKVDDLQDQVEDLRKDVVHRGVRPRPRQLETVGTDIMLANKELKKMEDYLKREKPTWTKIWEKELEEVCQGRDELRLMEDLIVDLRDDLEKASETFGLVEQATKEQMKEAGGAGPDAVGSVVPKQFVKGLINLGGVDNVNEVRDDVLGQVRALEPNHEDRLEAIERAERSRKKELQTREGNKLHAEITNFVEEGKLKKSGGFEEVERARKAKDDRIRREVWERQNGIVSAEPDEEQGGGEENMNAGGGEGHGAGKMDET